jgi:glucokinase
MRTIGLDLGGSKLLACLIGEDGLIRGRAIRATGRATGPAEACRLICDAAGELGQRFGGFGAAGVGFPGQVDFPRGTVGGSVMLDGWLDVPLADLVAERLEMPCVVDNDVNCAAVAELQQRKGEAPDSMLFVAVGTGIGGAITLGDRVWRGHTGVAGEIGNVTIDRHGPKCWCGRRGCLNTFASGAAIERQLEGGSSLTDQVGSRDPRVTAVVQQAAEALGIGLANALNLLNPALVVLGGGVAQLGNPWLEVVARTARAEAFPEAGRCRFELARAGYEAGAVGAALLAMECLKSPADPVDLEPVGQSRRTAHASWRMSRQ